MTDMSLSTTLSKISRLALLSVFCAGLFVTVGEIRVNDGGVEIRGNAVAAEGALQSGVPTGESSNSRSARDAASASGNPTGADTKTSESTTINAAIDLINLAIGILTFLVTPLIMLAGWLLSPDWTFGEVFGLRPILHQLWILISNVVYVIFGFMLVFIAFANIFGGEHSKAYEMKTMLPKLVTGMLMVPFTWFIVSAVLSVSNVLTASVIQLPVATILKSDGVASKLLDDKIIPKIIIFSKNNDFSKENGAKEGESASIGSGEGAFTANGNFLASDCAKGSSDCLSIKEFLTGGGGGAYNLLSVYAYGIFRIQGYKSITTEQKIHKVIDIASKLGFGIIFFVIFGILIIAIVYALFSRAVMLWLYAIFSPLFALNYVMDFKGSLKDSVGKLSIAKFISLAMVPVYVSAALAFGLMFLGLVMGASGGKADGTLKSNVVDIESAEGSSVTKFKFGEVTLTTIGVLDPKATNGVSGALDIGKGIIGTIIMNILALTILWMAVIAALGADDITKAAVAPIQGFGAEIGKLAMKAPQYIPIPLGKDKSISMAGMQNMGSSIHNAISGAAMASGTEFGQKFGNSMAEKMGLSINKVVQELDLGVANAAGIGGLKGLTEIPKGVAMRKILGGLSGTSEEIIGNDINRNKIIDVIKGAYDLKEGDLSTLRNSSKPDIFNQEFIKLAEKNKGKGLELLADNDKDIVGDKLSSVIGKGATVIPSTATVGAIDGTSGPQTITVKVAGKTDQIITLDKGSKLGEEIRLIGNDKTELKKIIDGKNEADAKALLKTIFKEGEINIDKLYTALK